MDVREQLNAYLQTGIVLDTDTDVLSGLDEEWALPCEFRDHEGLEPAGWVLYPSCCSVNGAPYILGCDACKDRKTNPDIAIVCDDCQMVYAPASLAWRLIEPLSKAA